MASRGCMPSGPVWTLSSPTSRCRSCAATSSSGRCGNERYRDMPVLVLTALPGQLPPDVCNGAMVVRRKPFPLDQFVRYVEDTASTKPLPN